MHCLFAAIEHGTHVNSYRHSNLQMNRPVTSASNLRRRQLCPGSARMELGLPEEDSEQSREGVLLHDYDAHPEYDRSVLPPYQRDLLERNAMLKLTVSERLSKLLTDFPCDVMNNGAPLDNGLISGTPDSAVIYLKDLSGWINDAKFGYKVVERAELNLQLRVYSVLMWDANYPRLERIFVSITQPRLPYDERITLAEYKPEDIEKAREEITFILAKANKPDAPLIAGEEQCRYCKAKMICPEFQKTMTVPALAIQPEKALSLAAREAYLEQQLAQIDDYGIEKLLLARAFANMISDPLLDEARKRKAISEDRLPNYFLTQPITKRQVVYVQRAIALLSLAKVATREEILAMFRSLPLGELEESYRKRTGCTWQEAREKINKVLASVIETHEEKPQVRRK